MIFEVRIVSSNELVSVQHSTDGRNESLKISCTRVATRNPASAPSFKASVSEAKGLYSVF